jgi:acetyl-CoA carboxylase carboxyl transferase subunit alpha
MATAYLDFEKPIAELDNKIAELEALAARKDGPSIQDELSKLKMKSAKQLKDIYSDLDAWRKTQVARHPDRPHFSDFIAGMFENFEELAGDRVYGNDEAIIGGLAQFKGRSVVIIGHEKGRTTEKRLKHNFGMAHPEGYRKAVRLMDLAEKFSLPVVSFPDTAGAYPGKGGEERGQAEAMRITAPDLLLNKIIDGVVKEPLGGAHRDPQRAIAAAAKAVDAALKELEGLSPAELRRQRKERFYAIGRDGLV